MQKLNAILLAGGESSRYGENKALINFKGRPLIEYIYNNLNSFFDRVIIIGPEKHYNFINNAEIKEDILKNKGPLGGLYTGLHYSNSKYNFLAGCDMPFLNFDYFSYLSVFLEQSKEEADYEVIVSEKNNYLEPLAAVYSKDLMHLIKKKLGNNELKIKSIYNNSKIKIIKEKQLKKFFNLEKLFFNINYPEDRDKINDFLEKN